MLPRVSIEVFLKDDPELAELKGKNNRARENAPGLSLAICFNDEHKEDYAKLLENSSQIGTIPVEYFKVEWLSFAGNALSTRNPLVRTAFVDATAIRLQSGADYYLNNMISETLDPKDRVGLTLAYRQLKETFSKEPAMAAINAQLGIRKGILSDKDVSVAMDMSQRGSWQTSLTPHLGDTPYSQAGKGEQNALKIMFALDARASGADVVLLEEPENHLSFSSLTILMEKIAERCKGKQVFVTTHSAYVLNKLGLNYTALLSDAQPAFLTDLPAETHSYFKRLSGYDTLRLILAKRSILVEGPSDELIVQKAHLAKHKTLPEARGVDVINVRGLSFPRFLDIAVLLNLPVIVVTDNDGKYDTTITKKYEKYAQAKNIAICASPNNVLKTLEDHIADVNDLDVLNRIFATAHVTKPEAAEYMKERKTECALRLFETTEVVKFPKYVHDAVT